MESADTRQIKFDLIISLQVPSILCYVYLIYHLVTNRTIRQSLHNHGPIILLVVGLITVLIDLSMILNFLRMGVVIPSNDIFCRIWNFLDFLLYGLVSMLMFWISIERHILIFHHKYLDTRRKRILLHYLPYSVIIIYLVCFYGFVSFILPCETQFDYTQVLCAYLCFVVDTPSLGVFDQLAHTIIPSILICIFTLGLWIRIYWQKRYRMQRNIEWRQHRKMMVQFLPVTILFFLCYLPYGFIECYNMINGPSDLTINIQQVYFFYLFYIVCLLHPFACVIGSPEIYLKWYQKRHPQIIPMTIHPITRTNRMAVSHF